VVYGGELFREPVVIDDDVMAAIDRLVELALLHNPGSIAGIEGGVLLKDLRLPDFVGRTSR